jgi:hypothetical protein
VQPEVALTFSAEAVMGSPGFSRPGASEQEQPGQFALDAGLSML